MYSIYFPNLHVLNRQSQLNSYFPIKLSLKVVGNEKEGGSGRLENDWNTLGTVTNGGTGTVM